VISVKYGSPRFQRRSCPRTSTYRTEIIIIFGNERGIESLYNTALHLKGKRKREKRGNEKQKRRECDR
jgi:hypothetical protein